MKAAVLYSTVPKTDAAPEKPSYKEARPLVVQELERPEPRAGELGVAITYSSLCHSDLSVVDGSRVRPLPMALGHEAVGRVVSVGAGVSDVSVGDHVVLVFVPSCGDCRACRSGRPALCHRAAEVNGSGDLLHGEALLRTPSGSGSTTTWVCRPSPTTPWWPGNRWW
jgi:Zn-dependent alcohol dehydrogenase